MNPITNWFCTMFTIVMNNFNFCTSNVNTTKLIKFNSTMLTGLKLPLQNNYSINAFQLSPELISDQLNSTVMFQDNFVDVNHSKWLVQFVNQTNQFWQTLFNYIDENTGMTDSRFAIWISHQTKTISLIILTLILIVTIIIIYVFIFKLCFKKNKQQMKRRYKNSGQKNIDERCYLLLSNSDDNMEC